MSATQLLEAYQTGRIGRRAFVRGLVALGFSVGTAAAHAAVLTPAASAQALATGEARASEELYETFSEEACLARCNASNLTGPALGLCLAQCGVAARG